MAKTEARDAVNFQPEGQNVEFQPDQNLGAEEATGRFAQATQNVDWNKVGIGVGAAAAVAGAAYAAKKFIGRGGEEGAASSSSGKGATRNER